MKRSLYPTERDRLDAHAYHDLLPRLTRIRNGEEPRMAFWLLAGFFKESPIESLGPRTKRLIANSLAGNNAKKVHLILDSFSLALGYLDLYVELAKILVSNDLSDLVRQKRAFRVGEYLLRQAERETRRLRAA